MKIKVEIISATECKSLNKFGDEPQRGDFTDRHSDGNREDYKYNYELWQKDESERKVYKIVNLDEEKATGLTIFRPFEPKIKHIGFGSIHEAEVNNETMEAIIL